MTDKYNFLKSQANLNMYKLYINTTHFYKKKRKKKEEEAIKQVNTQKN
jgi:hypothetical protein